MLSPSSWVSVTGCWFPFLSVIDRMLSPSSWLWLTGCWVPVPECGWQDVESQFPSVIDRMLSPSSWLTLSHSQGPRLLPAQLGGAVDVPLRSGGVGRHFLHAEAARAVPGLQRDHGHLSSQHAGWASNSRLRGVSSEALLCCDVFSDGAWDIFRTGLTSISWRKWFTETGQTITVTGQIYGHLYYYQSSLSSPEHAHTHTHKHTCAHTHACMHVHTPTHTHTHAYTDKTHAHTRAYTHTHTTHTFTVMPFLFLLN